MGRREKKMNKDLVWDRWCTKCGWRGVATDLLMDETTESLYRCPSCGADSDDIKTEQWHRGNTLWKG